MKYVLFTKKNFLMQYYKYLYKKFNINIKNMFVKKLKIDYKIKFYKKAFALFKQKYLPIVIKNYENRVKNPVKNVDYTPTNLNDRLEKDKTLVINQDDSLRVMINKYQRKRITNKQKKKSFYNLSKMKKKQLKNYYERERNRKMNDLIKKS